MEPPFAPKLRNFIKTTVTRRELARRIGCHETYLGRMANGKVQEPKRELLQKLASEMKITYAELMGETPQAVSLSEKTQPLDIGRQVDIKESLSLRAGVKDDFVVVPVYGKMQMGQPFVKEDIVTTASVLATVATLTTYAYRIDTPKCFPVLRPGWVVQIQVLDHPDPTHLVGKMIAVKQDGQDLLGVCSQEGEKFKLTYPNLSEPTPLTGQIVGMVTRIIDGPLY